MSRLLPSFLAAFGLLSASCGESAPPPIRFDGATRGDGGSVVSDGGGAGMDGSLPGTLDGSLPDGALSLDGGVNDAGPVGCFPQPASNVVVGQINAMAVATNGVQTLVAWTELRDDEFILVYRLETGPDVLTDEVVVEGGAPPFDRPTVVWDGASFWLAWAGLELGGTDPGLFLVQVSSDGTPGTVRAIDPEDGNADSGPRLVRVQDDVYLTWLRTDPETGARSIARRTVGETLGETVVVRASGSPANHRALAFTSNLLWAWAETTDDGTFIDTMWDPPSTPTGSAPVRVSGDVLVSRGIDLTADLGQAVVVWDAEIVGTGRREIRGRRLSLEGAIAGSERSLTSGARGGFAPSIVPFAGGYLGLWQSFGDSDGEYVHLAYIDPTLDHIGYAYLEAIEIGEVTETELLLGLDASLKAVWLQVTPDMARIRWMQVLCNF